MKFYNQYITSIKKKDSVDGSTAERKGQKKNQKVENYNSRNHLICTTERKKIEKKKMNRASGTWGTMTKD